MGAGDQEDALDDWVSGVRDAHAQVDEPCVTP
jgi:hypothetical protein